MLATVIDLARLGDPGAMAEGVEATKSHIRTSRTAPGFDEVAVAAVRGDAGGDVVGVAVELALGIHVGHHTSMPLLSARGRRS